MQHYLDTNLTKAKNKQARALLFLALLVVIFSSCQSEYDKLVKKELSTDIRYDTLLFDLKVGDSKKDFFSKCWELNKNKKIAQGSGNKYAKYFMEPDIAADSTKRVEVLFYGMFDKKNIMHGMEMKMSFTAWSPWNKDHQSDKLIEYIKARYMREYGKNPFIEVQIDEKIKASVKVDGNRQIVIFPLDEQKISVKITDLSYKD